MAHLTPCPSAKRSGITTSHWTSVAWVIRGQATATRLVIRHGSRVPTCPSGGNRCASGPRRAERFG